jgi:hypothetical protein
MEHVVVTQDLCAVTGTAAQNLGSGKSHFALQLQSLMVLE